MLFADDTKILYSSEDPEVIEGTFLWYYLHNDVYGSSTSSTTLYCVTRKERFAYFISYNAICVSLWKVEGTLTNFNSHGKKCMDICFIQVYKSYNI